MWAIAGPVSTWVFGRLAGQAGCTGVQAFRRSKGRPEQSGRLFKYPQFRGESGDQNKTTVIVLRCINRNFSARNTQEGAVTRTCDLVRSFTTSLYLFLHQRVLYRTGVNKNGNSAEGTEFCSVQLYTSGP